MGSGTERQSEAVILVGGLGTRLKAVVSDVPKPMAPINGTPFLEYVLDYLAAGPVTRVILATGYKSDLVSSHFGDRYKGLQITYSVEDEPLGTGGAIAKAMAVADGDDVFVLNGDTFFAADLGEMKKAHELSRPPLTMALKKMYNFDRFGSVTVADDRIVGFEEKSFRSEGYINGGIYLLGRDTLARLELPAKFSFEKDFLERYVSEIPMIPFLSDAYFIDIGIPEDYARAERELQQVVAAETPGDFIA